MQSRLLLTPTKTVYINQTLAQVLVIPRMAVGAHIHDLRHVHSSCPWVIPRIEQFNGDQ